jgi:hypothetical protein
VNARKIISRTYRLQWQILELAVPRDRHTVGMYDPLGHFVYLKSHGGFSYESGRKRNTAQATSSRARS